MQYFKYTYLIVLLALHITSCTSEKKKATQNNNEIAAAMSDNLTSVIDAKDYIVKVGDMAPDFEMFFPNGESTVLSSLRGKVVMLQFTASWCGVCRKEMPRIESDIWLKHKNKPNIVLYGIDREEPVEKIEELIKKTGVTYPIGLDPDAGIFTLFAKSNAGITRNVIIDKEGKIVMLTRLFDEEEFKEMVQLIDHLLDDY